MNKLPHDPPPNAKMLTGRS